MSARKLLIPIDAEDKHCGKCWILPSLKKICGSKYCHGQLLLYNYEVDDYLRCPACLAAEQKPKKLFDRLWKWAEKFCEQVEDEPLIMELNEILKELHAEVKE